MSGFRRMVERQDRAAILDKRRYAELRTVIYDGDVFKDIPVVLTGLKESDRRRIIMQQGARDHAQGLYMVSAVLSCLLSDLGGRQPEKGLAIKVNDKEGGGGFFREYTIASSICDMGMLTLELEAIDE